MIFKIAMMFPFRDIGKGTDNGELGGLPEECNVSCSKLRSQFAQVGSIRVTP